MLTVEDNIKNLETRKQRIKRLLEQNEDEHRNLQEHYTRAIKDYNIAVMNAKLQEQS